MGQQQEATAERLISIIQTLQMQRMSGTLTAKRGEGITYEEGAITFVKGQVTQTKVGRRNGSEALNWLSTWRECRYFFVSSPSSSKDSFPSRPSTPDTMKRTTPISSIPPKQSFTEQPTAPLPRAYVESITARQTGPLTNRGDPVTPTPQASLPTSGSIRYTVVPYRNMAVDDALRLLENRGLSRTHRHLFLLIDGQRSIMELVHLLKRNQQEVQQLLYDLERAALIQFSFSAPSA